MGRRGRVSVGGLSPTARDGGRLESNRREALPAGLPMPMTQVESGSARDRSRRFAPGARYTETTLDESVTERAAAARPPVRSQAAQYSTAGSQEVLRPAESGQREGGFLHDDAARPARSDSPYAAAGLLLSPPRHVGQDPVLDVTGHGQDLFGLGISDDDAPLRARSAAAFRLRHSTRAGTGTPASFPPWTAPEIRDVRRKLMTQTSKYLVLAVA